jgi:hypothetical protein
MSYLRLLVESFSLSMFEVFAEMYIFFNVWLVFVFIHLFYILRSAHSDLPLQRGFLVVASLWRSSNKGES